MPTGLEMDSIGYCSRHKTLRILFSVTDNAACSKKWCQS